MRAFHRQAALDRPSRKYSMDMGRLAAGPVPNLARLMARMIVPWRWGPPGGKARPVGRFWTRMFSWALVLNSSVLGSREATCSTSEVPMPCASRAEKAPWGRGCGACPPQGRSSRGPGRVKKALPPAPIDV